MRSYVKGILWGYAGCTATVTLHGTDHLVASTAAAVVLVILLLRTDWVSAWLEKQDAARAANERLKG